MARPTLRGQPLDVVASVRLTRDEADTLRAKYGSTSKGLRVLIDLHQGAPRCRIHTFGPAESRPEGGLIITTKECSVCGYISATSAVA